MSIVKISIIHNEINRFTAIPIKMIIFIGGVAQAVECLLIKHEALNSSTSMIKKKALLRKIEKTIMKFINNHKRPEWPKSFEQKEPSRMGCRRLMPIIIARSIRIVASGQPGYTTYFASVKASIQTAHQPPLPKSGSITLSDFKIYFQPVTKQQHNNDRKIDTWTSEQNS
jgi:hypothetical protein